MTSCSLATACIESRGDGDGGGDGGPSDCYVACSQTDSEMKLAW